MISASVVCISCYLIISHFFFRLFRTIRCCWLISVLIVWWSRCFYCQSTWLLIIFWWQVKLGKQWKKYLNSTNGVERRMDWMSYYCLDILKHQIKSYYHKIDLQLYFNFILFIIPKLLIFGINMFYLHHQGMGRMDKELRSSFRCTLQA